MLAPQNQVILTVCPTVFCWGLVSLEASGFIPKLAEFGILGVLFGFVVLNVLFSGDCVGGRGVSAT